ncbi:MAG: hypothetical protein PVI21_05480 [Candidatus Woesebacteria bacterium]|jgi:hypothetical protein
MKSLLKKSTVNTTANSEFVATRDVLSIILCLVITSAQSTYFLAGLDLNSELLFLHHPIKALLL